MKTHGVNYGVDLSNDYQYVLVFSEGSLSDVRVYDSTQKEIFPKNEERKIIIDGESRAPSGNVLTLHFNIHSRVDSAVMEILSSENHDAPCPKQHPYGPRIARMKGQYLESHF